MGKGEFPEVNRDARERQTCRLGLDSRQDTVSGRVKPAHTNVPSTKREDGELEG